jgi:hypothetical protein
MRPGLKSNHAGVKAHRAKVAARRLTEQGITRKQANVKAAEVARDYARKQRDMPRRARLDEDAHDSAACARKRARPGAG